MPEGLETSCWNAWKRISGTGGNELMEDSRAGRGATPPSSAGGPQLAVSEAVFVAAERDRVVQESVDAGSSNSLQTNVIPGGEVL